MDIVYDFVTKVNDCYCPVCGEQLNVYFDYGDCWNCYNKNTSTITVACPNVHSHYYKTSKYIDEVISLAKAECGKKEGDVKVNYNKFETMIDAINDFGNRSEHYCQDFARCCCGKCKFYNKEDGCKLLNLIKLSDEINRIYVNNYK